jgi:conjugative transfer signal peptidase TraF
MVLLGLACTAVGAPKTATPQLLWNASPSVPAGLYRLDAHPPPTAALAVIRLPEPYRRLAETRSYLRAGMLLIKPVAAEAGDIVCRQGSRVSVNGRTLARARPSDPAGRPLPAWSGCLRLDAGKIFVLSARPGSFDSRYIGPIERDHVLGTAIPVWAGRRRLAPA